MTYILSKSRMQIYPDVESDRIISARFSTTNPRINGFDITENVKEYLSFSLENKCLQNSEISLVRSTFFSDDQYEMLCHEINMYYSIEPANKCLCVSPKEMDLKLTIRYSLNTYKKRSKKEKLKFRVKNLLRKNNRKFKIEGPHENRVLTIIGLGKSGIFQ